MEQAVIPVVSQSIMTYLTCFYEASSFTCSFTINCDLFNMFYGVNSFYCSLTFNYDLFNMFFMEQAVLPIVSQSITTY